MNKDWVGIGEAAEILSLSRTSLQKLVDSGHLPAMKTAGGHRRIARASLEALSAKMGISGQGMEGAAAALRATGRSKVSVLVAEDDEVAIAMITTLIGKNFPDVECSVARDGLDAVLQLERNRPDVVITDLQMEPFDGFRLIRLVRGKPEYAGIAILVVSSLSPKEIDRRGGLPADVLLYRKPLNAERLLGYLDAHVQRVRRSPQS